MSIEVKLKPSEMLWRCSSPNCDSPSVVRRRLQYQDIKHCNKCSNRIKLQNPEFLKKRGAAISKSIKNLGSKWSNVTKKNMSSMETRKRHSEAMKKALTGNINFREIAKQTAIKNNKESGFGTSKFTKDIWSNLNPDEKLERITKSKLNGKIKGKVEHLNLLLERHAGISLIEFGHPDNLYRCSAGHSFPMRGNNLLKRGICPECSPKSKPEIEILDFVRSLNLKPEHGRRVLYLDETKNGNRALEIDIFVPSASVGIELNGLYYHNSDHVDGGYHRKKDSIASKQGIKLLQFFEDEWLNTPNIVKSVISAKFGIFKDRLYGRKLSLKVVGNDVANDFYEANHLQGKCKHQKSWALFHDGEMVSCLSARKNHEVLEISRFATKLNTQVIGGFQKLLSKLKEYATSNNVNEILTYADKRYSDGGTYQKAGFNFVKLTDPDMFWVKGSQRLDRHLSWGKNGKQFKELPKIFGVGHLKYVLPLVTSHEVQSTLNKAEYE